VPAACAAPDLPERGIQRVQAVRLVEPERPALGLDGVVGKAVERDDDGLWAAALGPGLCIDRRAYGGALVETEVLAGRHRR
jgi:hypothetical protein